MKPPVFVFGSNLAGRHGKGAALKPFAFEGMTWHHGTRVTTTTTIHDIEAARAALTRQGETDDDAP